MSEPTALQEPTAPEKSRLVKAGDFASRVGSLDPGDPIMRRGLHIAIGLVVLLGVGLAIWGTLSEFPEVDWRWRPVSLGLGVLGVATFLVLNAELWRRLLHALGPELPPLPASTIWFVSGLGRFVPTSLLTPMIRIAMSEREGVPKRICLVSVAYEIALALSGALIVGAYFIVDLPDLQGHWERFLAVGLPVIAVVALQPGIFHRLTASALERLGREPIPAPLGSARVFEFLGLYAVVYVLAGLSTFALGQAIYPMGSDDIVTVLGAFAVGTTLGIIAFVLPAGLVAREAGLAVALSPIMPTAPAVAIAVLSRVVQIAMEVLLATLTQVLVRRRGYSELDTSVHEA
jgi:glycosyltransferase 2 family protein